jgi:hypothetical protein
MKREAPTQKAGTGFSDDARDYLLKRFDKINNAQRFHVLFTSRSCFHESRRERTASSPLSSSTDAPEGAQCSKPASGHSSPSTPGALTTPLCASGKMLRVSCGAQRLPRHDLKTSSQYRFTSSRPCCRYVKRSEPNALLSPQRPRSREPEQVTNAAAPTANARRTCSPPTSRTCGSATSRRACTDCCTDGSRSPPLLCFSFPLFSPLIFKRSAGRSPARRRRSA